MQLLIANSKDAAQLLEDKAQAWLEQNVQGYNAGQWSDIFTDGVFYGIAFEAMIAPAFSDAELGVDTRVDDFGNKFDFYCNVKDEPLAADDGEGWKRLVPEPKNTV